jgi:hypothetical protein
MDVIATGADDAKTLPDYAPVPTSIDAGCNQRLVGGCDDCCKRSTTEAAEVGQVVETRSTLSPG